MPGSGKTQLITFFALSVPTYEIYANYWLNLPNYTELELEMFDILGRADNSIPQLILMDEGYVWIESRTSMKTTNRYLTHNLFQKRKRNQIICVTAQLRGSLDNRFRELAQIVIKCKERLDYFKYDVKIVEENEKTGAKELKLKATWRILKKTFEFLYPFYDTYEIIDSPDARDLILDNMTHERQIELANKYVDELLPIQDVWSKAQIEGYLWHHGETPKFAKAVYYELQLRKLNLEAKKKALKKGESKKDTLERLFKELLEEKRKKWTKDDIEAYLWENDLNPKLLNSLYSRMKTLENNDKKKELKAQGDIQKKLNLKANKK